MSQTRKKTAQFGAFRPSNLTFNANPNTNILPLDTLVDPPQKKKNIKQRPTKNSGRLIVVAMLISLPAVYYGFSLTFLSTLPKQLLAQFYGNQIITNPTVLPVLTGAVPIGGIFGSLLANVVMRYLTRRNYLITMNIVAIIINLVIQITNLWVLLFCRFVTGLLVGLYMGIVPIYIHEMSPPSISGPIGTMTQLQHLIGNVLSYFFGMIFYLCDYEGQFMLRFQYQFTSLLVITQLIGLLTAFIPESPNSLLKQGKLQQAKYVLHMFNHEKYIQKIIEQKLLEIGEHRVVENTVQLSPHHHDHHTVKSSFVGQDVSLFHSVYVQQQLQMTPRSYFLSFQLPLTQQFTGVNFIVTQLTAITAIYNQPLSHFTALMANLIQLASTGFSAFLFGKVGRRTVICVGNVVIGLLLVMLGIIFLELFKGWQAGFAVGMTFIMIFNVALGLSIGPVVWIYIPEIAQEKMVPVATATYWVGCSICVIIAPIITTIMGTPYAVFFFLGGYLLVVSIPNILLVVETKGFTPSEINKKFKEA